MHSALLVTTQQSYFYEVDEAVVYLNLQPDVGEEFPVVPFRFTITAIEGQHYTDAGTVYLDLQPLGGECYSTYSGTMLGEGEADGRWSSSLDEERWFDGEEVRWSEGEVTVEGINC